MNTWPRIYKINKISEDQPMIKNIESTVSSELEKIIDEQSLTPGAKIAITAGSRGISNIVLILQTVVKKLQMLGYQPFLFSAMGSHGGGTAEGQKEILRSLGITEEAIGCEISTSADVIKIGETEQGIKGLPVYIAEEAYHADGILVINRVKAHTSFSGEHESGLVKMMAVGMGRAKGASMVHKLGAENLAASIPAIAHVILDQAPVIGGIALVENSLEDLAMMKGVTKENIFTEDRQLLKVSKSFLSKLPVNQLDFAVVQQMGKNFSGTGMDTNVIGRLRIEGVPEREDIQIKYLAVLDLSEASHGNANGLGLADFTTKRLVDKMDKESTYLNCITSGFVIRAAIPMTFDDDEELFDTVKRILRLDDIHQLRMVIMKNTLHLDELWVSEAVYKEALDHGYEKTVGPLELQFDSNHMLDIE